MKIKSLALISLTCLLTACSSDLEKAFNNCVKQAKQQAESSEPPKSVLGEAVGGLKQALAGAMEETCKIMYDRCVDKTEDQQCQKFIEDFK